MKIGLDTNILLRLIINDDVKKVEKVIKTLKKYSGEGDIFISNLVFLELFWVLKNARFGLSREDVLEEFEAILLNKNFSFENDTLIRLAISKARQNIEFDDAIIGLNGYFRNVKTLTFDKGLKKDSNFVVL